MNQVVMQHLELDGIPEPVPRATEDAINELMPPLAEHSLHPLPDLREQELPLGRVGSCNEQHLGLCHALGALRTAVAQVTDADAAVNSVVERQRRLPVIPVR